MEIIKSSFNISNEGFFGREEEIVKICRIAKDNLSNNIIIRGKIGTGKSEILKRVYERLFLENGDIIPFYYSLKSLYSNPYNFAKSFLSEFLKQTSAFLLKDSTILNNLNLPYKEIVDLALGVENRWIKVIINNHIRYEEENNISGIIYNALSSPHQLSIDGSKKVLAMIDDFKELQIDNMDIIEIYKPILDSKFAKHLIVSNSIRVLKEFPCPVMDIGPLPENDAILMFEDLCNRYRIKYNADLSGSFVYQLDRMPLYIYSMIRTGKELGISMDDIYGFLEIYSSNLIEGELSRFFYNYLSPIIGNKMEIERLYNALNKNKSYKDSLIGRIINGCKSDMDFIISMFGTKGKIDPLLIDFIRAIYKISIEGRDVNEVKSELIKEGVKNINGYKSIKYRNEIIKNIKRILKLWNNEEVPAILFNLYEFQTKYLNKNEEDIIKGIKGEKNKIRLPKILGLSEDGTELCLHGLEEKDIDNVVWLVKIYLKEDSLTLEDLDNIKWNSNLIRNRLFKKWIIIKEGIDKEAGERLNRLGILSSNLKALNILSELFGIEGHFESTKDEWFDSDFELNIPISNGAELVATATLEEIANSIGFGTDSIERMKSSLVEACINAFEHSKSITGKITIRFVTQKNKLLIIVRDYGKGFDPASIIRKRFSSIRNRGWGIIIMKRFMNSVTFDSNKEGSQVKMTKYL